MFGKIKVWEDQGRWRGVLRAGWGVLRAGWGVRVLRAVWGVVVLLCTQPGTLSAQQRAPARQCAPPRGAASSSQPGWTILPRQHRLAAPKSSKKTRKGHLGTFGGLGGNRGGIGR